MTSASSKSAAMAVEAGKKLVTVKANAMVNSLLDVWRIFSFLMFELNENRFQQF
jgi:hypothetical protein